MQAQILNLFERTKRELGLTCLFVSHNLAVIRYVSDRVAVMQRGKVVESRRQPPRCSTRRATPTPGALLQAVPDVAARWPSGGPPRKPRAQGAMP